MPNSIEHFFPHPISRQRVRAGPLGRHIDAFATWLAAEGYTLGSAQAKLRFVADLSRWLEDQGLPVEALDEQRVSAFLLTLEPRHRHCGDATTGRQLLGHLRANLHIPAASTPGGKRPIERILDTYERFLLSERGLCQDTASCYRRTAGAFLAQRFGTREIALERLTSQDVSQFVLQRAQHLRPSTCRQTVTQLRSFLRHLHQRGDLPTDLSHSVPPVRVWREPGLPKALAPAQVESLLDSCDPSTALGCRDRAILLLLARLGLRASEVVALTLDDFDWSAGVVSVPGKDQRREPLPLPSEVGEAVAEYLRAARPPCSTRRLFIRMRAPHQGFGSYQAISYVVRRALERAGVDPPFKGTHTLRHSLATTMLGHGASLEEIGRILRHAHPETTQIYARVDFEALRPLAPAWPGGVA